MLPLCLRLVFLLFLGLILTQKIRQSLKIEKEKKPTSEKGNGKTVRTGSIEDSFEGIRIDAVESVGLRRLKTGK